MTQVPYSYTNDDPVNGTDPLGLSFWSAVTGIVSHAYHAADNFYHAHKLAFNIAGLVLAGVATVASGGILLAGAGAVELGGNSLDTVSTVADLSSIGSAITDSPGCLGQGDFVACVGMASGGVGGAIGRIGAGLRILTAGTQGLRALAMLNLVGGFASAFWQFSQLVGGGTAYADTRCS